MYVIINGVNSDTIQGLQILSLPPITKPKMRTSVATIDGRPGDIVTYLGYEAYNKTIKILLHDTYDLPAIMAYFNQSGTIILSNDPDKIYTFETIEQINYERAVKFKTASVTIHVQPYKLSASEQSETGEVETLVDRTPYIIRRTPFGTRQKGTIIGGSIVWNQLLDVTTMSTKTSQGVTYTNNGDGSITLTGTPTSTNGFENINYVAGVNPYVLGHVYLLFSGYTGDLQIGIRLYGIESQARDTFHNGYALSKADVLGANGYARFQVSNLKDTDIGTVKLTPQLYDLTLMFGPTIADYIYSVEQSTAGAGVALAKKWAGITGYVEYDAGTLKSVSNVSAHVMRDSSNVVMASYPLDSSLTLRGIPKLDSSNNLYYDGDVYKADGTVERKYGVVDLGTLTWSVGGASFASNTFSSQNIPTKAYGNVNFIANGYTATDSPYLEMQDKTIRGNATGNRVYIRDTAYTDAAAFKTAMSGAYLVYELAEPTTEQAEPYTELQICDPNGTEEFVGASMPVGHETTYIDPISMTVTNEGNTESAPSITIEGEGAVEVTVDGLIAFEINMPTTGAITIDSKAMDATDGDGNLANRSVSGDYTNLQLAPGEHTIVVVGDVSNVTVKNVSRWL